MPTRIFFSNNEQVTVSDELEAVAKALSAGGMAKLDRPWGDSSIYVNPSEVMYIEMQDERSPDIEAMEAGPPEAPASAPLPPAPPAGGTPPHPQFPR
jgi:hypothetical protein